MWVALTQMTGIWIRRQAPSARSFWFWPETYAFKVVMSLLGYFQTLIVRPSSMPAKLSAWLRCGDLHSTYNELLLEIVKTTVYGVSFDGLADGQTLYSDS